MSTRKRRWGAILLTVCMALSLMTTGAHAAGEEPSADFSAHEVNVEDPYPEGVTVDLFDYWLEDQNSPDSQRMKGGDSGKYKNMGISSYITLNNPVRKSLLSISSTNNISLAFSYGIS